MAKAASDLGNLDVGVELRQAEERRWNHFWKSRFQEVWSFPKNSVAPDEDMSFFYVTTKTVVVSGTALLDMNTTGAGEGLSW